MNLTAWDQTVANPNAAVCNASSGPGSLLQIHPLKLSGQPIELIREQSSVGREDSRDITIQDSSVSRHHAQITRRGEQYTVSDLGSTNGTYTATRITVVGVLGTNGDFEMEFTKN